MLQYAQANFSALIESTQDMIWSVGLDYRLISFNPAIQQYIQNNYGVRLAEGMCFHEELPPEQAKFWPVFYERVLAEGPFRIECSRADGGFMDLAFDPIAVDGDITGISIIGKDITQRKAAEDVLHEAGEKYRNIFDGALKGIFQTTLEGRALAANPAVARMLGYDSPEDFISSVKDTALDVWAFPNDRTRYLQLLEEAGELRGYEVQLKRKDGTRIWVKLSTRKTYAADGVTPITEGFIEEITEQKKSESALKKAEANLSALIESTQDLICSVDLDYRLITFNRALQQNIQKNYGVRLAAGMRFHEVLTPEHASLWPGYYACVLAEGPFQVEYTRVDGGIMELAFNPIAVDGITTGISIFGKNITERKAAEESRLFLAEVVESCEEAIITSTPSGVILSWNHGAEAIYGYSAGEAIGKPFSMIIAPERKESAGRIIGQILRGAPPKEDQGVGLRKDGSKVYVTVTTWPIRSSAGEVTAICTIVRDVSARHEAEKARALLASIVESSGDAVHAVNLDGTIASWNPGAERLTGYASKEILGKNVAILIPPGHVGELRQSIVTIQDGRIVSPYDVALLRKDGSEIDVSLTLSPIRNAEGAVSGAAAIARDISERKRTEAALRESLDSLQESQAIGGLGSYVLDIGTGVWTSSDVLDEILGIDKEYEHTITGWENLIHPDDRAMMAAYFAEEVVGKGRNFNKEYRMIRQSDHAERWVHGIGRLEFGVKGQPVKMRGVIKDITDSKRTEMQLRESEERYRTTFEQAAVGIVHTSIEGQYLRCNARFAEIIGYPQEEVSGLSFQQITVAEDLESDDVSLHNLQGGAAEIPSMEKRYVRKDGSLVWVRVTLSSQRDGEGKILYFIAIVEDIQERKEAEARLTEAT